MPTPTKRFATLANMKSLFSGLKQKYVSKDSDATLHSLTASGEVTATEGTGASAVTHNLTEKLDASKYRGQQTWGDLRGTATWGSLLGTQATGTSTSTTNISLTKPGYDSTVDVDTFNDNMDTIDAAIAALQSIADADEVSF